MGGSELGKSSSTVPLKYMDLNDLLWKYRFGVYGKHFLFLNLIMFEINSDL